MVAVTCVLCCVYFAVVLWCVLFFVAVCFAAGALVVSSWVRCVRRSFSKTEKLFPAGVFPCVPCPRCMQQYHTLKKPACFIYLILRLGLVCTPGLVLDLVGCVPGVLETVHLKRKGGGKRVGDGAVAGGEGTWRIRRRGREVASAGASRGRKLFRVLRAAREVVSFNYSASTATRGTSLCSYIY